MASKVLNVSEARRLLPGLVRGVGLSGAVAIGSRGQATAVLVGIQDYEELCGRSPGSESGSGWSRLKLETLGTIAEVEAELRALRRERADGGEVMPQAQQRRPRAR